MSRILGQIGFVVGFFGLLFQIVAIVVKDWQVAPGGSSAGLWTVCNLRICSDFTRNGLTAAQWGSLWSTRAILILSALIGAYGMYVCGVVMQEQGNRSLLQSGMRAFLAAALMSLVAMVTYMVKLTLPDHGQKWSTGVGMLIVSWLVWHPLAAGVLRITMGAKKYYDPAQETAEAILREASRAGNANVKIIVQISSGRNRGSSTPTGRGSPAGHVMEGEGPPGTPTGINAGLNDSRKGFRRFRTLTGPAGAQDPDVSVGYQGSGWQGHRTGSPLAASLPVSPANRLSSPIASFRFPSPVHRAGTESPVARDESEKAVVFTGLPHAIGDPAPQTVPPRTAPYAVPRGSYSAAMDEAQDDAFGKPSVH